MEAKRFDCIIVGAGPAGISAAARLARAGLAVVVVEAGAYPGAENWSGAVYFTENLEDESVFGSAVVEGAPWERKVVRRGLYAYDGETLVGAQLTDPAVFRSSYTVLRPVYDRYLAEKARELGVLLLNGTTVESLIKSEGKVIGVMTDRGPLYGAATFLAEGDASHLTTMEGFEKDDLPHGEPRFLQGVKEVIRLPEGEIERRFGLQGDEGACYEILIRNANRHGRDAQLNMGVFLYTNRDSVSLGYVLPLDNLRDHFDGSHHLVLEWLKGLPQLAKWLEGGEPVSFGTKIIRGGGLRESPTLVADGLAIGGAASGVGVDFPYPNFTGPASLMGQLFADGLLQLRREGLEPTAENLARVYETPLSRSHYVDNVRYLESWPDYIERSTVMFDNQVDTAGSVAYALTHPEWTPWRRLAEAVRAARLTAPPTEAIIEDQKMLAQALRIPQIVLAGLDPRCWLWWIANVVLCWFPARRDKGLELVCITEGRESKQPPWLVRWWWYRFRGALGACFRHVYTNDRTPIASKLAACAREVSSRASLLDLLLLPLMAAGAGLISVVQRSNEATCDKGAWFGERAQRVRRRRRLDDEHVGGESFEAKLGRISYEEGETSHIKVMWPEESHKRGKLDKSALWSVCPAKVYERTPSPLGAPAVVVNFDNCIKCESCWRAVGSDVHWSRATTQQLIYETYPPAQRLLVDMLSGRDDPLPRLPRASAWGDAWLQAQSAGAQRWLAGLGPEQRQRAAAALGRWLTGADRLERATAQFGEALAREPRHLETTRVAYLRELAIPWQAHARELAAAFDELRALGILAHLPIDGPLQLLRDLERVVARGLEHAASGKLFWADVCGRQLRGHHLTLLGALAGALQAGLPDVASAPTPTAAPFFEVAPDADRRALRDALEALFGNQERAALEREGELSGDARAALVGQRRWAGGSRSRTLLWLEELARIDGSLAFAAAADVQGRRLLELAGAPLDVAGEDGERWLACARAGRDNLVPTLLAGELVVCGEQGISAAPLAAYGDALAAKPTTGFVGARLAWIHPADPPAVAEGELTVRDARAEGDHRELWLRTASGLGAALCRGVIGYLLERAVDHADSRVQFGSTFQDELGTTGIGKFGAVKRMLAQIAGHAYALDTLAQGGGELPRGVESRIELFAAAAAFGPHEGSAAYNAGQVFGGTAISEDDVLAKAYRDSTMPRYLWAHEDRVAGEVAAAAASARAEGASWFAGPGAGGMLAEAEAQLRAAAGRIEAALADLPPLPESDEPEPVGALIGRAVIAGRSAALMLRRTQALLDAGEPARMEVQATRLAVDQLTTQTEQWLARAARVDALVSLGEHVVDEGFWRVVGPEDNDSWRLIDPPARDYDEVIHAQPAFRSGTYLLAPTDTVRPRHTPELKAADPKLLAYDREMSDHFRTTYYEAEFEGKSYCRHLEDIHELAKGDAEAMHELGFLRVYIPTELGGQGLPKAWYYTMVEQSMRWADPSWTLVVMGNSSIGTTPAQIGLKQDLPKAERELGALVKDASPLTELVAELGALAEAVRAPQADEAELVARYQALAGKVTQRILKTACLRFMAGPFNKPFRGAGKAGLVGDLERMAAGLDKAKAALEALIASLPERFAEIPLRKRAGELFLQLIAHGQMSAFALTEPTAGSDSGGVKTVATLTRRRLEPIAGGFYRFYLDEANQAEPRTLLDVDRLVFQEQQIWYRPQLADGSDGEPVRVMFDRYDYEADATKTRYVLIEGEEHGFDDIAQLRRDDDGLYWSYYELNGAKMWITNGRICGVMALYAKTPEGVTGFLVDRHAEGLIVGADEEKLGQRGSATNEISLLSVRCAAENVIGFAGRGQVNALETLNVGRGGLCVSCGGIGADMLDRCRQTTAASGSRWHAFQLGQLAVELLSIMTIAHEVTGHYDGKDSEAVRVESAIGKYWASEALHRMFGYEEALRGLASTTHDHDVEKKRRDARVLNIYEGTNEVQRFLLLKDLSTYLLARYKDVAPIARGDGGEGLAALTHAVEQGKDRLFAELASARARRGDAVWAHPSYQPTYLRLSELAAQLKIADSLIYRLSALDRYGVGETAYAETLKRAGQLAIELALQGGEEARTRYASSVRHLNREHYPPEVQLGYLLLEQAPPSPAEVEPAAPLALSRPLEVRVALMPGARVAPQPRVDGGALREPLWELTAADRAALAAAAALKARAAGAVNVVACGVTGPLGRDALREALSAGADRVVWAELERTPAPTDQVAAALLRGFAEAGGDADLVLCGEADGLDGGAPGLAAYLAAALESASLSGATAVTLSADGERLIGSHADWRAEIEVALPAVASLAVSGHGAGRGAPASAMIAAAGRGLERVTIDDPAELPLTLRAGGGAASSDDARATDPASAAALVHAMAAGGGGGGEAFDGALMSFAEQDRSRDDSVVCFTAVARGDELEPASLAAALRAGELARAWKLPLDVVVPAAGDEDAVRALVGQLQALGARRIYLPRHNEVAQFSWRGLLALSEAFLNQYAGAPRAIVGPAELSDMLAQLARGNRSPLLLGVDAVENGSAPPRLVARMFDGRVEATAAAAPEGAPLVIGVRPGAVSLPSPSGQAEVYADDLPVDYRLADDPLAALVGDGPAPLTLANAEVVVDVGYALKTQEDLEAIAYPLEALLRDELGLKRTLVGATRKVTQDLKILPDELQIGQTGTRVAPRLLLALGVSGAPQHIDWIGKDAVIVAFNSDPTAPLMQWNRDQALPVVHPIVGDLFETVPAFMAQLRALMTGEVPAEA